MCPSYQKGYFIVFLLIAGNAKISGCFESQQRGMEFEVSYLKADVELSDISKSIIGSMNHAFSQISCGLHCLNKRGCVTAIYKIIDNACTFLKENLKSTEKYIQITQQDQSTKSIVLRARDPCRYNPCLNERECVQTEIGFTCICANDEGGDFCEVKFTGLSCLDIKNKFSNYHLKNGKYVISPTSESFNVYCDMEFDEGGWTQVSKVVANTTDTSQMKFREISSLRNFNMEENYAMTSEFLQRFRSSSGFMQFRFQCRGKLTKRTIHMKTHPSATAIVEYLVGASVTRPGSCGGFTPYKDDDSILSRSCGQWDQKSWGINERHRSMRLLDHPFFVHSGNHFLVLMGWKRFECDDYLQALSIGDFWNVYVR